MSKLTAERARERIQHLQLWQQQRGLTLREEEYLEALELALTVLEPKSYHTGGLVATQANTLFGERGCERTCATPCNTDAQYESLSVQAALGHGLERYGDVMKKLAEKD